MGHIRGALLVIAGLLLSFAQGIRADSLQLKNGNFVQGKYMGGTDRAVQFEVNGKMRLYDINQILSISFAAASVDGGMPSDSAEAGHSKNAERCVAAKRPRAGSAGKGEMKSAKMQSAQDGLQNAAKGELSSREVGQEKRSLRLNWTGRGYCDSAPDSSCAGARLARVPERIDVMPA
jgi:hypothetical protein